MKTKEHSKYVRDNVRQMLSEKVTKQCPNLWMSQRWWFNYEEVETTTNRPQTPSRKGHPSKLCTNKQRPVITLKELQSSAIENKVKDAMCSQALA